MIRPDYLTMGIQVYIFIDHANFQKFYDPEWQVNHLPKYWINKLTRWALKLSAFNYIFMSPTFELT